MSATHAGYETSPLPTGAQNTTLALTVRGNTVTVHGLLVAETVDLVLAAVGDLGARGWADVTVDAGGIHAVDASAAAALATAQIRLPQGGTTLHIQVPYASTRSMFPGCVLESPAQQDRSSRTERLGGAAR